MATTRDPLPNRINTTVNNFIKRFDGVDYTSTLTVTQLETEKNNQAALERGHIFTSTFLMSNRPSITNKDKRRDRFYDGAFQTFILPWGPLFGSAMRLIASPFKIIGGIFPDLYQLYKESSSNQPSIVVDGFKDIFRAMAGGLKAGSYVLDGLYNMTFGAIFNGTSKWGISPCQSLWTSCVKNIKSFFSFSKSSAKALRDDLDEDFDLNSETKASAHGAHNKNEQKTQHGLIDADDDDYDDFYYSRRSSTPQYLRHSSQSQTDIKPPALPNHIPENDDEEGTGKNEEPKHPHQR